MNYNEGIYTYEREDKKDYPSVLVSVLLVFGLAIASTIVV